MSWFATPKLAEDLDIDDLIKHVKKYEGTGPRDEYGRFLLYSDSVGEDTIGYGINLSGRGLDENVVELQLRNDLNGAIGECRRFSYWGGLSPSRKLALVDLVFNLGLPRFKNFIKTNQALVEGDYDTAADELIDSRWYKQVGRRARKVVDLMRNG